MAVQNSTITVKGKLGNIVGYKGRGGQKLARIRQTEVKNPKTVGQMIQRCIIATAARAYGKMKSITDHSFEGITYGGESQSYFLAQAAKDLRAYFAANYPEFVVDDQLDFKGLSKPNEIGLAGLGLLVSQGSLQTIPVSADETNGLVYGATLEGSTIQDVMNAVGARPGDQITVMGFNGRNEFRVSRYIINNDADATALAETWDGSGSGDAFDPQTSVDIKLTISSSKLICSELSVAGTIILSRKEGSSWKRSTQRLYAVDVVENYESEEETPADILLLWMEGTTPIETENPYYLNQAEQVGE